MALLGVVANTGVRPYTYVAPGIFDYRSWLQYHGFPNTPAMHQRYLSYVQAHSPTNATNPIDFGPPVSEGAIPGNVIAANAQDFPNVTTPLATNQATFDPVTGQVVGTVNNPVGAPPPAAPVLPPEPPPDLDPIRIPGYGPDVLSPLYDIAALPDIFNPQRHTIAATTAAGLEGQGYADPGTTSISSISAPGGAAPLPPLPVIPAAPLQAHGTPLYTGPEAVTLPKQGVDVRYVVYRGTDGRLYRQAYANISGKGAAAGSLFSSGTEDEFKAAQAQLNLGREQILQGGESQQTTSLQNESGRYTTDYGDYIKGLQAWLANSGLDIPTQGQILASVPPPPSPAAAAPAATAPAAKSATLPPTAAAPAAKVATLAPGALGGTPAPATTQTTTAVAPGPAPAPAPTAATGFTAPTPDVPEIAKPPQVAAAATPNTVARSVAPLPRGPGGTPVYSAFQKARSRLAVRRAY